MAIEYSSGKIDAYQAFDILWEGLAVFICYPPDFSAENEYDIYDTDYPIFITDIISRLGQRPRLAKLRKGSLSTPPN